jgi:hypothetical protein
MSDYLLESERTLKEGEVRPIHLTRVVAELAGLIERRGARFALTQRGRELHAEARSGELYALLFETWFRRFNLGYSSFAEWPELQHQIAFTLYRLSVVEAHEQLPADLLATAVLPFAREGAPTNPHHDLPGLLFEQQCLVPLEHFGLLSSSRESDSASQSEKRRFHVTPLYGEFLTFRL